jgi:hypothetical protein
MQKQERAGASKPGKKMPDGSAAYLFFGIGSYHQLLVGWAAKHYYS